MKCTYYVMRDVSMENLYLKRGGLHENNGKYISNKLVLVSIADFIVHSNIDEVYLTDISS